MDTWMILLVGASAIAAVVLALRPFLKTLGAMDQGAKAARELLTTGTQTRGRILQVQTGGMSFQVGISRSIELVLQVEVQPERGAAYPAAVRAVVGELQLSLVQPGVVCELRVDAGAPTNVALEAVHANGVVVPLPPPGLPGGGSFGGLQKRIMVYAIPGLVFGLIGIGVALWAVNPGVAGLVEGGEAAKLCEQATRCCDATEAALGKDGFVQHAGWGACGTARAAAKHADGAAGQREMASMMCTKALTALAGSCGK